MSLIDNLFSQKLKNHQSTPSERANQLFLSKLEKNKKVVFWTSSKRYFAAAASVTMILSLGYLYNSKNIEATANIVNNKIITNATKTDNQVIVKEQPELKEPSIIKTIDDLASVNIPNNKSKAVKLQNLSSDSWLKQVSIDESHEFINNKGEATNSLKPEDYVALVVKEDIKNTTEQHPSNEDDTYIEISPLMPTLAEVLQDTPPAYDYLPNHDFLLESVEPDNTKLLAKMYEEIKHLKKGEKIDFNKFGLKSLEELALNEEGFIVTEARQIKNTFNRILSRITN